MSLQTFVKEKIFSRIYRWGFNLISFFPVKKNIVLFETFNGKPPSDNPYAIYKALNRSPKGDNIKLLWSVKPKYFYDSSRIVPKDQLIKRFSLKWLLIMPRAKFWVFNSRVPNWLKKNNNTIYIQTWHGTPLKKIGVDIENVTMPNVKTSKYRQDIIDESERWNYLIAPNQYSHDIFRKAFKFKNTFLDIGYPRNDVLVDKNNEKVINEMKRKILGTEKGRVILYAPTWRDDEYIKSGRYKFKLPFELDKIISMFNQSDVLIIRPHYLVGDSIDISSYEDHVKVINDIDISDLYLISDLLITDYSSVFFDYGILEKPMLFFAYDLLKYKNEIRGFYLDYLKTIPGPLVVDSGEFYTKLNEFLANGYFYNYEKKLQIFHREFCSWEKGSASEKVASIILERVD